MEFILVFILVPMPAKFLSPTENPILLLKISAGEYPGATVAP